MTWPLNLVEHLGQAEREEQKTCQIAPKRSADGKTATSFPNTPLTTRFFLDFTYQGFTDMHCSSHSWDSWESSRDVEGNYKSVPSKNRLSWHIFTCLLYTLLIQLMFSYTVNSDGRGLSEEPQLRRNPSSSAENITLVLLGAACTKKVPLQFETWYLFLTCFIFNWPTAIMYWNNDTLLWLLNLEHEKQWKCRPGVLYDQWPLVLEFLA